MLANPRLVGHDDADGTVQQLAGVENVVDFFILYQAVGVDARPRRVEFLARKRVVGGDLVASSDLKYSTMSVIAVDPPR